MAHGNYLFSSESEALRLLSPAWAEQGCILASRCLGHSPLTSHCSFWFIAINSRSESELVTYLRTLLCRAQPELML